MIHTKIAEFIEEGKSIKQLEYHDKFESGLIMLPYISGEQYDLWMNEIKMFASRYLKHHPLYNDILDTCNRRNNQWGTTAYDNMMSYLNALLGDSQLDKEYQQSGGVEPVSNNKKIFISHSSLDIEYVKLFVSLLESIGFASCDKIFCSSISGYYIPNGQNIYDYLKTELRNDSYIIFFLSDNYYLSPACMNEMGAAWITSKTHTAILIPGFEYYNIKGSIDASKIWFKMNDKDRINDFKNEIIKEFNLNEIEDNYWERKRDEYLSIVNTVFNSNKYKNFKQRIEIEDVIEIDENEVRLILRFMNKENTSVVCKSIDIQLIDFNDKRVSFCLKYCMLKTYVIYGMEHKRITIDYPKTRITNFDNFAFNKLKTWIVDSHWPTYTG